jgi:hypothetical protein
MIIAQLSFYSISKLFSYSGIAAQILIFCRNIIPNSQRLSIMPAKLLAPVSILLSFVFILSFKTIEGWQSKFVKQNKEGNLRYIPDEKGNIIPDFSRVGYYGGDKTIPDIAVVKTVSAAEGNSEELIQSAIDEVAKRTPDKNGFRGTILLKKGIYKIPGIIKVETSGIVLRGEGNDTKLVATDTVQRALILVSGKGTTREIPNTRIKIMDDYVPVGTKSFTVAASQGFRVGDKIIVYRPGTEQWIKDLKMDQIEERNGTKQWKPPEYNIQFERMITKIEGNKIFIDNPIVLAMETKYGGGEIFKYSFDGRISNVGIENLYCESEYKTDTSENHGWDAIHFDKIENGWVRNITSKYFGYSCVNLDDDSRNITVTDCNCFEPKSIITGGRRYSFNNTGQMNLFMNCHTTEGRHDFVTGARTRGPNVFYNCMAKNTHADIGPHHRWGMGTLYDNITTDGEINIQDRGNYGSGHGWAGVNQILWNCTVKRATVQTPYVNGKNYCIGLKGEKAAGRFKDRPDGEWEGQNKEGLQPVSLYIAQLNARKKSEP